MINPLVIFDLDGTLIDTAPDLLTSLNHAIEPTGAAPVDMAAMNHLVGKGAKVMIARALELREVNVDTPTFEELFDRFLEFYAENMPGSSSPFPGLMTALDRLDSEMMPMAVCTNKMESMAVRLLELLSIRSRFSAVLGGDSCSTRKPDPGHISETIRRAGGHPDFAVMIGDSYNDIAAATNAGIPSIAVTFGYTDIPARELGADHVIDHFDQLTPDLVRQMLADRSKTAG